MTTVNLDAIIRREDFEVTDIQGQNVNRNTSTLALRDLAKTAFFFSALRKPDFQRETSDWDAQKVVELIESFLTGDLIPAIILWNSAGGFTFVIDGSHRLSALAAWVNDDYGDGPISKDFYESQVPEHQIRTAERTRELIRKKIGKYSDYELALTHPEKVTQEIVVRARQLGRLALQVQWVDGDARKAEASFFKINQQATPINPTELILLQSRRKPNCIAARAIIRSGTGHKYWARFAQDKQETIQKTAQEIHTLFFAPPLRTPVKTLDLPIGGKVNAGQTLPLLLNFINIVNGLTKGNDSQLADDETGDRTIEILQKCRRIAQKINSNNSGSLGLHPAVYFYSHEGQYKPASFYGVTSLVLEFDADNEFTKRFIKVRPAFESFLASEESYVQQIARKYRSGLAAHEYVKEFYKLIINELAGGKNIDEVMSTIQNDSRFNYLIRLAIESPLDVDRDFSEGAKSVVFLREAISQALRCKICKGYIHSKSITIDHITRKKEGGLGVVDNGQIAHPYCNTTFKN